MVELKNNYRTNFYKDNEEKYRSRTVLNSLNLYYQNEKICLEIESTELQFYRDKGWKTNFDNYLYIEFSSSNKLRKIKNMVISFINSKTNSKERDFLKIPKFTFIIDDRENDENFKIEKENEVLTTHIDEKYLIFSFSQEANVGLPIATKFKKMEHCNFEGLEKVRDFIKDFLNREKRILDKESIKTDNLKEVLIEKSIPHIQDGDFREAITNGFIALEEEIRDKINVSEEYYGIKLVDEAFNLDKGKLSLGKTPAEKEGVYNLFRSMFLTYRNSSSHRFPEDINRAEAYNVICSINNLFKLLEKAKIR